MEENYPKVNIVILNYNGKDVLKRCLSSVFRIEYPNLEVVLVDNNSNDGSFEFAKTNYSRATFIKNDENLGFSAGNNIGIKYSLEKMADYVLLLGNDMEVEKDFLNLLLLEAEKEKKAGLLNPIILESEGKEVYFSGGKIDWLRMKKLNSNDLYGPREKSFETEFICGQAMLIRAEVFRKAGLLDEDFFFSWEDVDFCVRAKRSGFDILVVPSARARYFSGKEVSKVEKVYWSVISELIFFQKNSPWYAKPWIFLFSLFGRIRNKLKMRRSKPEKIVWSIDKAHRDFKIYLRKNRK